MKKFKQILAVIACTQIIGSYAALQKTSTAWISPIGYTLDNGLSADTKAKIKDILKGYVSQLIPGLKFTELSNRANSQFIEFKLDTTRTMFCEDETVDVGPKKSGPTVVTITENANLKCGTRGWILHLLMHALGFYHEHQRSDRGNYVFVNSANSQLSPKGKVALLDIENGAVVVNSAPYDYMSVTHYHFDATAIGNKRTILALPIEYYSLKSYGHSTNMVYTDQSVLSKGDIAALQVLFPGTPTSVPDEVCSNGGAWHNWCLCKPGFAGRHCTETYCYHKCQNSGYCGINADTGLPGCVCPSGYSGTYCEIRDSTGKCGSEGKCPWWSTCDSMYSSCKCDPYPFHGPTCSIATISMPIAVRQSTSRPTTTASTTSASHSSHSSPTTRPSSPPTCTANNVGAPRSVTFSRTAVYLRIALHDIKYRPEYANLGSPQSVALQNFLAEAFQGDYQTQTDGKFISVHIQNIQPPIPGSNRGCTVVDYLARFTSALSPRQRSNVVQATYAKATSSNLYTLFGTLDSNKNKATIVSSVLFITPLNSAVSPASPCVVYSSEGSCLNGGSCTASGAQPQCVCRGRNSGTYCGDSNNDQSDESGESDNNSSDNDELEWPIWQIVVVSIAAAVALMLAIMMVTFFVRQSQACCGYGRRSSRYYGEYGQRHMQMQPSYYVPTDPLAMQPGAYYPTPQMAAYGQPSGGAGAMPPPYGNGGSHQQRPKHYQYPYNIQ